MSERFFTPDPLSPGEYTLSGPESHHLATVLRLGPGARVVLFNGDGNEYPAEVVSPDRKRTVLNIRSTESLSRELPFRLHLAVALPKGDRGDFLVEKLTELGVTQLTPLHTTRTVVQPKESRVEKLRQAVIEASKQCGRNVLMRVDPLTRWSDFLAAPDLPAVRAILHPPKADGAGVGVSQFSAEAIRRGGVVFAVGPEGGFTEEEVSAAEAAGWQRLGLGPRVLRIETAALAAAVWAATLQ